MIPIAKPLLGTEEKQAVLEVLESGMLAQGPKVQAFEDAFATYCGAEHAVATSSGTTALHLALLAHGVGPGDQVITTPFTFISTANAILYVGATPVFVDIDPMTFNLDPEQIEEAVNGHTRAILPVHLFGLPADMDPLRAVARKYGLVVIEDACQAHGADDRGQMIGSCGTACFSFYPTKNMTAGEGGMIVTGDQAVAERCRALRQYGSSKRYYHHELGYNFRMSDIHAAIGLAQLEKLEWFNRARIINAIYLSDHLHGVVTPYVPVRCRHVFHQYTVRVPSGCRDALAEHLEADGVGHAVYYPLPVHKQELYVDRGYGHVCMPVAERAALEVLSLPVHPGLSVSDLDAIIDVVNSFWRAGL